MQIFVEIAPLKAYLAQQRDKQFSVGLVPTMGALHEGHLSLIRASRSENDITVCSVYVNPVQFNNPSDLEKYPRTLEKDISLLTQAGCDVLFAPSNQEMYPEPSLMKFDFGPLDKVLEGAFRPGHFSGVALVVSKLFNIVTPSSAYFGQKDYQQFMIISKLVNELRFNIRLVCAPIVRETDGLAMSSRNARLNKEQRQQAVILSNALAVGKSKIKAGNSFTSVKKDVLRLFEEAKIKLEYFEMAERKSLISSENASDPSAFVLLIAAFVGEVRLIDNMFLTDN